MSDGVKSNQIYDLNAQALQTATNIRDVVNQALSQFPGDIPHFKDSMRDKIAENLRVTFDHIIRKGMSDNFSLSIRLEREDGIPAFGGFLRCEKQNDASPVIFLNVQACMAPEMPSEDPANPGVIEPLAMSREERKRLIISTLMHEFGHALESHFRLPVNEDAIEKACEEWEQKFHNENRE